MISSKRITRGLVWVAPTSLPLLDAPQSQQDHIQSTYHPCNFTVLSVILGLLSASPMRLYVRSTGQELWATPSHTEGSQ